jgi:hypothetical protein
VSRDAQVGPLTVNAAGLAIVPAESAQFLNIMRREQPISAAVAAGTTDTVPVQQDCGPTSMAISRLIVCHPRKPAQVRGTEPGRHACHGTVRYRRANGEFSQALAGLWQREGGHDPGRIGFDAAVMIADGGYGRAGGS